MKTSYSLFQSNSHKKHRFHIPEPLEIEPHEFTAPNKVYNQEDSQRILAHFRACGSYPKPNPNKVEKGFESGIMIGSTYNQFEKIHEYSLVYSSYCLERDDHLLCSNPSIVQVGFLTRFFIGPSLIGLSYKPQFENPSLAHSLFSSRSISSSIYISTESI